MTMGKHVRGREALAPSRQSVPVPTADQVVVRALPAAFVMAAGFPLLAWWWSLNEDSPFWAVMAVLGGGYFLGWGILRITQVPRPRLGTKAEREPVQRAIAIAAENGVPPVDPVQRAAAGAVACESVEWIPLGAASVVGFVATAFITEDSIWAVPAVGTAINSMLYVRQTRRSWRYLKALSATPPAMG